MEQEFSSKDLRGRAKNMAGLQIGRLAVLDVWVRRIESGSPRIFWKCACECGNMLFVRQNFLSRSHTRSCGCLVSESIRAVATTHGLTGTSTHAAWVGMRSRCRHGDHKNYADYGGRGIAICDRWDQFENFLKDMGECPPGMSLDRENNDGPYSPENCRWATSKQQSRNTRRNVYVTAYGETRSLSEWAEIKGIPYEILRLRFHRGEVGDDLFKKGRLNRWRKKHPGAHEARGGGYDPLPA